MNTDKASAGVTKEAKSDFRFEIQMKEREEAEARITLAAIPDRRRRDA